MTRASPAYLVVRAVLADAADRPEFDRWYAEEHLPDAMAAFGVAHAWRCWSVTDPLVHYAQYRFPDAETASAAMESDAIRALIAEFDRAWGARVTRTRDVVAVAQEVGAPS